MDWELVDVDTQHLTHNLHRYSGKFIPQIARQAMELISMPGELVLDPYMGSGTTLLEAACSGRRSVGIDLNPLAVLISNAKVTPLPQERLASVWNYFADLSRELDQPNQLSFIPADPDFSAIIAGASSDERMDHPWFTKWFQKHVLWELVVLHRAINEIPDDASRNLSMVAFSNILRRLSNAHSGYPNIMFNKDSGTKPRPIQVFMRSLRDAIAMVERLSSHLSQYAHPTVLLGNAVKMPLADETVDAIVSHPPYIGSIPYAEYGALSLMWLGKDPKGLDCELTGGKRQSKDVVERFRADYSRMLRECHRILRPGRKMFLMVGNPVVRGDVVDLARMTCDLAADTAFELVALSERRGVNRRANKMGSEALLFFEKCT